MSDEMEDTQVPFPIMKYFTYAHLPQHLQAISIPCTELAWSMIGTIPPGPELEMGLRKLLEAKDCFVRGML